MANNSKKTSPGTDVNTPKEADSMLPSPDTSEKLDEFKDSLRKQKNSVEEREKLLLSSLDSVFNASDIKLLDAIDETSKLSKKLMQTLLSGSEVYLAILALKKEKNDSPMDIIDKFTFEKNAFSRSFIKALIFIHKNKESEVSKWYLSDGFHTSKKNSSELILSGEIVKDLISDTESENKIENKGLVDDIKTFVDKNKTAVGLFAFAGAAVGGIWLFNKLKGGDKDSSSFAGAKIALTVAGGAFIAGQVLGMDEVRKYLSKDKDSWINSRYIDALTSLADGEFQNAKNAILYGPISPEDKVKYGRLATIFDVDVERVTAISKMNFDEFIEGNASFPFQFASTKESEEKIRTRIKDFYLDDMRLSNSDLSSLSVGQALIFALERGLITEVDKSDLTPEQQEDVSKVEAESKADLESYESTLLNPTESTDEIIEGNRKIIDDLQKLDASVDSVWGDIMLQMQAALGWPPDVEDSNEYGDLKQAREYLLTEVTEGMAMDHSALEQMQGQVADFSEFLEEHRNEDSWSESTNKEFEIHKKKILDLKLKVNNAIVSANEARAIKMNEDIKVLDFEDITQGGELVLVGVLGNVLKVVGWEMQELVDDETDTIVYVLAFTQVAGALTEYAATDSPSGLRVAWIGVKNLATGPFKAFKLFPNAYYFYRAFEYSPDELLLKLLSGEMDKSSVKWRLDVAKKYTKNIDRASPLWKYADKWFKLDDRLELLEDVIKHDAQLQSLPEYLRTGVRDPGASEELKKLYDKLDALAKENPAMFLKAKNAYYLQSLFAAGKKNSVFFDEWIRFFNEGVEMSDEAKAELAKLIPDENFDEFKKYINESDDLTSASARLVREILPDGKIVYKLDGKVIELADKPGPLARVKALLIAEAEKRNIDLKFPKIEKALKYVPHLIEIFGVTYAVHILFKIQTANNKDELRQIVAEELAAVLTFLGASWASGKLASKFSKNPTFLAIVSLFGGLLAAVGCTDTIESVMDSYIKKFPNGNEIVVEGVSGLLQDITLISTLRSVTRLGTTEIGEKYLGKVGLEVVSRVALEKGLGQAIGDGAIAKFQRKILQGGCGQLIKKLIASVGTKVGGAALTAVADGPIPIGDIISVILVGWAIKDVYDIGNLIWKGKVLSEELEKRMTQEMEEFDIISPPELKEKYKLEKFPTADALLDSLMKEKNAVVKIKRKGVLGYEIYSFEGAEVKDMAIYDVKGDEIASISDEDLEAIVNAEAEIDKSLAEKAAKEAAEAKGS